MGLQRTSRCARSGANRKRRLIGASLIATGGVVLLTALPASAHINESSATCLGVIGKATNYNASDTNTITMSIDGTVVFSSTFAQNIEHVVAVAQDGHSHTWHVAIDSSDNRWDSAVGGSVGPCGGGPTTTLPPTTLPPTTLPPTTAPETTLPPTTLPPTTFPPTTLPETTLPETTLPATTLPETSEPTTTLDVDEGESSTTLPPTTLPPTTLPETSEPTTTLVGDEGGSSTTTTLVGDEGGSSTTVSPGGGGQLPSTGSGIGAQAAVAAMLMCTGGAMLAMGRRRPQER